ncbi:MAG: glycosyltransferase family 2 protein [Pseudomonadales bacterium]|nr:glycosyltransferase family 2 protein [Halioglobus sp.]MCP5129125.1 glycosyltransferase family 2 protein [Pseudomonadales bacterium]
MNLDELSVVILTFDEAPNIGRVLEKLTWCRDVVVLDSFSADETEVICRSFRNVSFYQRKFDNHWNQWNAALDFAGNAWVLSLDADYIIDSRLLSELRELEPQVNGYSIPFRYCVNGYPLRASLLPPRIALFDRRKARYVADGHTQLLACEGPLGALRSPIYHDDRKPLKRWLASQDNYMDLEVKKLLGSEYGDLGLGDKVRKLVIFAPFAVFFYCLVLQGCILNGRAGWFYALQRLVAEAWLSVKLLEASLGANENAKRNL